MAMLEEVYIDLFLSAKFKFDTNYSTFEENNLMKILLNKLAKQENNIESNQTSGVKLNSNATESFKQQAEKSKNYNTII